VLDLVLLDMQMPELDGVATARRIRRDPATAELPVVMLTSIGSVKIETARALASVTFLLKPAKHAELKQAIVAATSGRCTQGRRPTREPRRL